jgi:hypothetical protein
VWLLLPDCSVVLNGRAALDALNTAECNEYCRIYRHTRNVASLYNRRLPHG